MILAELDPEYPGKIVIKEFEYRYKVLLNSVPSAHYNAKKDLWTYSLTWHSALGLQSVLGKNLTVSDEFKDWMIKEYSTRISPAYSMRMTIEPEGSHDILPEDGLFPHQKGDVLFLSTIDKGILMNDPGTGKTQSSISSLKYMHQQGKDVFPVLVMCPNSTKFSWEKEINRVWPEMRVVVINGTAAQRKKQFKEEADFYVINWESIRTHSKLKPYGSLSLKRCVECGGLDPKVKAGTCEAHFKELNEIGFKSAIADEIHRIKDPSTKIARAAKAASEDAEYKIGLTGTPIANSPEDLFSPMNWLLPDAYPSKTKFIDRFCITADTPFGGGKVVVGIRPEMQEEFLQGIDPFTRRMSKEAVLPFLPPIIRSRRDVEMGTKQKKAYDQMKEQMLAVIEDDVIVTTSPLTALLRMLQLSSAYAELTYEDRYNPETGQVENKQIVKLSDPSCKLDAFMEDIEEFGDQSVIVFAASKQLINMLSNRLDKAGIPHGLITGDQDAVERQRHMENFQNGRTKFILCTIAAGGTGITLTKASTMVFLQRSWSMVENIQAEARGHRIGSEQHDSVFVVDYVTKGSAEENVFKAVEGKKAHLEFILRDKELMKDFINANEIDMEGKGTE